MLKRLRKRSMDELKEASLPIPSKRARLSPIIYGAGMIGVGLLLRKINPRFGEVPNPLQFGASQGTSKHLKGAAFVRDRAALFAPANITDKLGSSLLLGGMAMITARVLDEAVGRKL